MGDPEGAGDRSANPEQHDVRGADGDAPDGTATGQRGVGSQRGADGGSATAPPPGASGPGFTADKIFVGYGTTKDADQGTNQLGLKGNWGDQEAHARIVVKDINSHGGIDGRKIELVFHDVKSMDLLNNPQAAAQAACEKWTHDRPVFAVVNWIAYDDNTLSSCLAKRKTILISTNLIVRPKSAHERIAPFFYAPTTPSVERLIPKWLGRLSMNGYFKDGWDVEPSQPGAEPSKVGLVVDRTQYASNYLQTVRSALTRVGQSLNETAEYSGNFSNGPNEMASAVLRFRRSGITHVILPNGGASTLLFMQAANSQNYRPRYALHSANNTQSLQSNAPKGQLTGSLSTGYVPALDVDSNRDPGPVSRTQTRCTNLMEGAGQDTSVRLARYVMLRACDGFNFASKAISSGGLAPAQMHQGVQSMSSMEPASTFGISFPDGRFDGASKVRDVAFDENRSYFKYVGVKNHGM